MKIGILTLPPTINYGGILQAYALQCILDRMGHEAEIICDRQRHFMLPTWKKPFVYFKRLSLKHLLGKKKPKSLSGNIFISTSITHFVR